MKTLTLFKNPLLFLTVLVFTLSLTAQTTYIVNNNVGTAADFTDLQAAIDAAIAGDVIYVQQSATSYGNITINKGLTIIGRSHSDGSYKTEIGTITLADGASNSTIKGLKTTSINDAYTSTNTISNLAFFDCNISGISIGFQENYNNLIFQGNVINSSFYIYNNTSNVLVTNNLITTATLYFEMVDTLLFTNNVMTNYSVNVTNASTGLLNISNSIFVSNYGTNPVTVSLSNGSGTIQVNNCVTYNYGGSTSNFSTGAGITINANVQENTDPLFTSLSISNSPYTYNFDPINDNLTLQGSSTVVDAGIFEGYVFKNFGTPTGLPSIKIDSYSPTVPKNSNLNVTITAKTN